MNPVEDMLQELCEKHGVPLALVQSAIQLEREKVHLKTHRRLAPRIIKLIEEHTDLDSPSSPAGGRDDV